MASIFPTGWQSRLDEASTKDDVVGVCKEFLALWTAEELAQLPASCQPKAAIAAEEVNYYALTLIRQSDIGDRSSAPLLHRMSTFFTKAALRLAQITVQSAELFSERRKSRFG
jgi:hypothetical protein